jgi:hypothetical protein
LAWAFASRRRLSGWARLFRARREQLADVLVVARIVSLEDHLVVDGRRHGGDDDGARERGVAERIGDERSNELVEAG